MSWGCANQYLVSLHKPCSPLRFTASREPPAVTLHFCLPNDLTSPFTSLHINSSFPSLVSQGIMGLGPQREEGRLGLPFLPALFRVTFTFVCCLPLLCLFSLSFFSCLSSRGRLVTSLLSAFLYLHPPVSNLTAHYLPSCVGWDLMKQLMLEEYWW